MTGKIKVAVILPQPQCNMYCNFCVTEDNFDRMTYDQGTRLLEHIKGLGVKNIVIGGGEPFFWPYDIIRYCEEAKDMGFLVQVGTNGTLLPKGFEELDCIDRYVLPIESVDMDTHDSMRQFRGSHHGIIIECLERLGKAGKSVTFSTVITEFNKNGIIELASFLREYNDTNHNIHAWHLYQFIPLGRWGKPNAAKLQIPPEQYENICRKVKDMELPFHIFKRSDMYHSQTVEFFWFERGEIRCMGGLKN